MIPFIILLLVANLLFAQEKSENKSPDEQIKVNKEYDEAGNLIRYDSSYVKSWSSDTTLTIVDMDSIRKEMDAFFGNDFQNVFSDTMVLGNDPFLELHQHFFKEDHDFFDHFSRGNNDSTLMFTTDSLHSNFDFDKLREEMMNHFGQFFQNDSTSSPFNASPDSADFDFFFDQDEFDRLRDEFEKHFEQLNPNNVKPQKMGATAKDNTAGVIL